MKQRSWLVLALALALSAAGPSVLQARKSKAADPGKKVVDSGIFSIFVQGKRVGSETFRIEQDRESSTATTELRVGNSDTSSQTSQLQMALNGDLLHYDWKSLSPEKSELVVEPNNEFLTERVMPGANTKPMEVPLLLPHSTLVLDDNNFVQREILVWRYLAGSCSVPAGGASCPLTKTDFGVLVPSQHISMRITIQYKGKEKVQVHGAEQELDRFDLGYEDGSTWALYLDQNMKLMRIVIDAASTEVVRD